MRSHNSGSEKSLWGCLIAIILMSISSVIVTLAFYFLIFQALLKYINS